MVVRHPLQATISYFNEHWGNKATGIHKYDQNGRLYLEYAPIEVFHNEKFADKFPEFLQKWIDFHEDILKQCNSKNCVLIFYDHLKTDMPGQMTKILKFLGDFEINDELKGCLMYNSKGNFKRRKRPKEEMEKIYNLFSEDQRAHFDEIYENYKQKLIDLFANKKFEL